MKKTNQPKTRDLRINRETLRALSDGRLVAAGNLPRNNNGPVAGMFPLSDAYPTICLAGTGCGNMSGTCC